MSYSSATQGLLVIDFVILNHFQVTRTKPELASSLLTTAPTGALDRFNVHRSTACRVFGGTRLELLTRLPRVHYLYLSRVPPPPQ
ncbi:hypothetical protein TNCV_2339911 [Trichonephila clavipes]|nr:hypothetical protein TNCV_2339911 [Trichonephila clavipes]